MMPVHASTLPCQWRGPLRAGVTHSGNQLQGLYPLQSNSRPTVMMVGTFKYTQTHTVHTVHCKVSLRFSLKRTQNSDNDKCRYCKTTVMLFSIKTQWHFLLWLVVHSGWHHARNHDPLNSVGCIAVNQNTIVIIFFFFLTVWDVDQNPVLNILKSQDIFFVKRVV